MNPGLDGPERNVTRLGDFPVGHSCYFFQHQRLPLVCGQRPKGRIHLGPLPQFLLRVNASGFRLHISRLLRDFDESPLPAGPPERVMGRTDRDPA